MSGDIVLRNMIINGNLTIDEVVNDGNVTLDSVTVKGNTYVNGGGASNMDSVNCMNFTAADVYVAKPDGAVKIVASGNSIVKKVMVSSETIMVESAMTGTGFGTIQIQNSAVASLQVSLMSVKADSVQINSSGTILISDVGSTISTLTVDAANTKIKGLGIIDLAKIKVSGTTFEKAPTKMTLSDGVATPQIVAPK